MQNLIQAVTEAQTQLEQTQTQLEQIQTNLDRVQSDLMQAQQSREEAQQAYTNGGDLAELSHATITLHALERAKQNLEQNQQNQNQALNSAQQSLKKAQKELEDEELKQAFRDAEREFKAHIDSSIPQLEALLKEGAILYTQLYQAQQKANAKGITLYIHPLFRYEDVPTTKRYGTALANFQYCRDLEKQSERNAVLKKPH